MPGASAQLRQSRFARRHPRTAHSERRDGSSSGDGPRTGGAGAARSMPKCPSLEPTQAEAPSFALARAPRVPTPDEGSVPSRRSFAMRSAQASGATRSSRTAPLGGATHRPSSLRASLRRGTRGAPVLRCRHGSRCRDGTSQRRRSPRSTQSGSSAAHLWQTNGQPAAAVVFHAHPNPCSCSSIHAVPTGGALARRRAVRGRSRTRAQGRGTAACQRWAQGPPR